MAQSERPMPLEHVAAVYVDVAGGYVDVQQSHGNHTHYTPEEAREIAREILAAADEAERASRA